MRQVCYITDLLHNRLVVYSGLVKGDTAEPSPYMGIEPLNIVAGGIVPPDGVVGRHTAQADLLNQVVRGRKGALLLGDRRIGKTCLLGTLHAPLEDAGHLVIRVSAETASMQTFGRELTQSLQQARSRRARKWAIDLEGQLEVNVGVGKFVAKASASRDVEPREVDFFELCTSALDDDSDQLAVFIFDEITVLATNLANDDQAQALEFLRTLRRARQSSDRVVMFLAGSIGLHHAAIDDTEVNDLARRHIDVLDSDGAMLLALRLLAGLDLQVTSLNAVVAAMVRLTSGFPYYIQSLAEALQSRRQALEPVSPEDVHAVFEEELTQDVWNIRHYNDRIDDYYRADAELVRAVVDYIALSPRPVTVDELAEVASVAEFEPNRTQLIDLLDRLERDHYLRRAGNADEMANEMLRGFWLRLRRLA